MQQISQEEPIQSVMPSLKLQKPKVNRSSNRFKYNQTLYQMFVRKDFVGCMKLISYLHTEFGETHEFANFIKGLVHSMQGQLQQSVDSLKRCLIMNDKNAEALKYISRNLFFLGRYKASIEVAHDALRLGEEWELYYTIGQCHQALRDQKRSFEAFQKAYDLSKNERTFIMMGRLYTQAENYQEAIKVYQLGLQNSVQNSELMTTLGILYLRIGENDEALRYLEHASSIDGQDTRSIFESYLQIYWVWLRFFRTDLNMIRPFLDTDSYFQVWNNVGMCFYGKKKYIAAIACLKKALYFDPFEWIIHFNLGLVHMTTQQQNYSVKLAISLKPDYAQSFMYLGMALNKLDDLVNCCRAMERALDLDKTDYLIYLNFVIILCKFGGQQNMARAKDLFKKGEACLEKIDEDTRCNKEDVYAQRSALGKLLGVPTS